MFKSQGRKDDRKKAPILIDKQSFQRTLKVFDHVDEDEGNLSNIQEEKNNLIFNIREELECLDKNLKDTLKSNNMIVKREDSCVEADDPLPAWLQLFLERSDSFKNKTEEVEHENIKMEVPPCEKDSKTEKITEDGDNDENLSQFVDHDKFMATTKIVGNDSIIKDQSNENNALKSKISKLKNVFNFPQKSRPSMQLKVQKYVATCDLKEKFEKLDSDNDDTSLIKAPPKKLKRIPSFEINHLLNKEKKNWKWKHESLKVVDDASSSLIGNDEIPNEFSDEAPFNEKATIEKLLELIDDSQSQSQTTEKFVGHSKVGKKIGHLDKCKTQDLFKDQRPLNTPSPMVSKLSRSLSFLNRPDNSFAQKSNNELRSNNSFCTEAIKEAFENKVETASSEVMKNRVQKKILESPWSQIQYLDNSKDVSQEKEIKYWKPKAVPAEPLRMRLTGFQQPQTRKSINSPDILNEKNEEPSQQITFKSYEVKDDNNEDDFEDILNYEDSPEIKAYEKELRARYELEYNKGSCDELSDNKSSMKSSNSFSSLMNILTTMRKTRLTRSVSACKLNLLRSSEAPNPKKFLNDDFEEILTNEERKANYERATSCQNSKKDLTNLYNEELHEVKLHRKEKVIRMIYQYQCNQWYPNLYTHTHMFLFRFTTQPQQVCLICPRHGVLLVTWMRKL